MDKRIIKTRRNILDVFIRLLEEKPVGDITAQEIAALAEISRSTFYQHYTDVYHLLDQAEDEIFADIAALLEGYPCEVIRQDPLRLFTELFFYFRQNSKICAVLLNKNGSITTGQRISRMIREKFRHEWEALLDQDDELAGRYLSQYIISGFVGILQQWIAGGMAEAEEEMALVARVFINNTISNGGISKSTPQEVAKMSTLKDKIRGDARSFAGGVLNDASGFLDGKSEEIRQKVEAGLGAAGSRLARRADDLQAGGTGDAAARQRQKLLKKKAELVDKFAEKADKLAKEGKEEKLAEKRQKHEEELRELDARLAALDAACQ